MTKGLLVKLLIGVLIIGVAGGLIWNASKSKKEKSQEVQIQENVEIQTPALKLEAIRNNTCEFIPKELIEEAIGRPIVKVENVKLKTIKYCSYYTHYIDPQSGGADIAIGLETEEDYSLIKKDLERTGNQFVKDERIPVEHYLIKKGETIWEVDLFLNDKVFLGIKSNHQAATGEELIKIALKILETKKDFFASAQKMSQESVPLPQDVDAIYNLVNLIEEGRSDDAAKMMKVKDDSELQAWAVQFSNINSFKLLKIEKVKENQWTDKKHIYKVTLDVWMNPDSASAPIPYYGWENGENIRWVTLEKLGNIWKISEINSSS